MKPKDVFKTAAFLTAFTVTSIALVVICRTLLIEQPSLDSYCVADSDQPSVPSIHRAITADRGIFERFQQALRFRTITKAPKNYSANETLQFIQFLKQSK